MPPPPRRVGRRCRRVIVCSRLTSPLRTNKGRMQMRLFGYMATGCRTRTFSTPGHTATQYCRVAKLGHGKQWGRMMFYLMLCMHADSICSNGCQLFKMRYAQDEVLHSTVKGLSVPMGLKLRTNHDQSGFDSQLMQA